MNSNMKALTSKLQDLRLYNCNSINMNLARKRFSQNHISTACEPHPLQTKTNNHHYRATQNTAALISEGLHEITKMNNKHAKYEQNDLRGLEMSVESDNEQIGIYLNLMQSGPPEKIKKDINLQTKAKKGNPLPICTPAKELSVYEALRSVKGETLCENAPHPAFQNSMSSACDKSEAASFSHQNEHDIQTKKQIEPLRSSFYHNNCRNLEKDNLTQQQKKTFREELQCSISNFCHEQNSNEKPYFQISAYNENLPSKSRNHITEKDSSQNPENSKIKIDCKEPDKRLTLRDYLYISQLSQNRQKNTIVKGQSKCSTRPNSRKKKSHISKGEVLVRIKDQISQSIKKIQHNLQQTLKFVEDDRQITNQQDQIMKMYSLCRMIKEQMVGHSEEVAHFIMGMGSNTQ